MSDRSNELWNAAYCASLNAYMSYDERQMKLLKALAEEREVPVALYIGQCCVQMADLAVDHKAALGAGETCALAYAAEEFLASYAQDVACGDWGKWDMEKEPRVIKLRAAIAKLREGQTP